jgi:hypothetical protein
MTEKDMTQMLLDVQKNGETALEAVRQGQDEEYKNWRIATVVQLIGSMGDLPE